MRLFLLTCLFFALTLVNAPASASAPSAEISSTPILKNIRFEHLGLEDGLSQSANLSTLQDQQGYLWFGTQDGLNRYDGYTFTIFRHDPQNSNSLTNNSILPS